MPKRSMQDFLFRWLGDTDDLERASKRAAKALGTTDKAASSSDKAFGALKKGVLTLGAAFGARELIGGMKSAIDAASNLGESVNAVQVVMGDASHEILQFGESAAENLGLSQRAVNDAAVAFSAFGEKINSGNVAGVFKEYVTRATDFASVMNLDVQEALDKFRSGLAGESEPLRAFGIDVSAAAVGAYAMANGISESASKMTEAEKIQARYGLIMEQTEKTAGDFANTSESLANQTRQLSAEWENAQAAIGEALLPIVTDLAPGVVDAIRGIEDRMLNLRRAGMVAQEVLDFLPGIPNVGRFHDEMIAVIDAQYEFNRAMREGKPRMEALEDAMMELHRSGQLNFLTTAEFAKELNVTDREMVALGRSVQNFAVGKAPPLTKAVRDLSMLFRPYVEGVQNAGEETETLGERAKSTLYELEGLNPEIEETADASDDAADAVGNLADEFRELVDPVFKAKRAQEKLDEVLKEVTKDGKLTTDEIDKVAEANLDLQAANEAVSAENIEAYAEAAVDAAVLAGDAIRDTTAAAKESGDPLLENFEGIVSRLEAVTGKKIQIDLSSVRLASEAQIQQAVERALFGLQRDGVLTNVYL